MWFFIDNIYEFHKDKISKHIHKITHNYYEELLSMSNYLNSFSVPLWKIINELGQKISHTDWNLPTDFRREYLNIFQDKVLSKFIETQNKFWNAQLIIANIWFQVYRKGDYFKAHTHPHGNFTNVFFLHLPNKNLSTKLKAQGDVEINIDLDEGDILTIPAYLKHESPLISQDNEKYILSFNSSITT